jgi:hypothetical protein
LNVFYVNRLVGDNDNVQDFPNVNPTDAARTPVVLNMQPGGAKLGEIREVLVQGGNFLPGVEFALGGGIQVLNVERLSLNEARIQIRVSEQASLGPRAVYARNTTGAGSLTKNGMFQVFQELESPLPENAVTEPGWLID